MDGGASRRYPVEIVAFAVSPGHSYWFHSRDPGDGVGPHPTLRPAAIDVVAGRGVVGDRFFGRAGPLHSPMSFVAAEAVEEVAGELGLAADALDPVCMRRTVVLRGADLNALRRRMFAISQPPGDGSAAGGDDSGGVLEFQAGGETSPCAWMDAVLAPGARDLLRGRGGLRATPLTSGRLRIGPAELVTDVDMDSGRAGRRVRRGRAS